MSSFSRHSAFEQERIAQARGQERLWSGAGPVIGQPATQVGLHRIDLDNGDHIKVGAVDVQPPLEHWHHDLTTIDILLSQDPPDIDRAREIAQDLAREIYQGLH